MNKIEQELLVEINNAMDFTIESEPEINDKDAAKYCYSLLEKHCIGFGEFLGKYPDKNRNYKGEVLHAKSKYDGAETTEQLFKLYIEKL
jgi:hypothetical protein